MTDIRRHHIQQEDLELLRPAAPSADATSLQRHMDACVAASVRLGLTTGAAIAAHDAVMERFGPDLARADQELVRSLLQLLGMA